jgi:hypothetical protein
MRVYTVYAYKGILSEWENTMMSFIVTSILGARNCEGIIMIMYDVTILKIMSVRNLLQYHNQSLQIQ